MLLRKTWKSGWERIRRTPYKAVVVVHNETSSGVTSRIAGNPAGDEPFESSSAADWWT